MLATNTKIDELIALGTKQGLLYDTQVVEMLDGLEDVDFNAVYETIEEAHIKIIPDDNIPASDAGSESVDPATDWGGGSMDSVSIYLHDIGQYDILTKEEEHQLSPWRSAMGSLPSKSWMKGAASCLSLSRRS